MFVDVSVILVGKRDCRRQSTTSLSEKVVVSKTSHFATGRGHDPVNKDNSANFSSKKK